MTSLPFERHLIHLWNSHPACSLVGFSQPKPASQQCFPLTKNQHELAQTSTSTNQRTGPSSFWLQAVAGHLILE